MSQLRNIKADVDDYLGSGISLPSFDDVVEQYVNVKFGGLRQSTLQQLNPDADNYNDLVAQLDEEIEQVRSYYTEEGQSGRERLEQKFNDLKARISAAKKAAQALVDNTSSEIAAAALPGAIGAAAPNPAKIALDLKNVGSRVKTLIDNVLKEISTALGIAIELGLDDPEFIESMFGFISQFISDQEEAQQQSENAAAEADVAANGDQVDDSDLTFNGYSTDTIKEQAKIVDINALPLQGVTQERLQFFVNGDLIDPTFIEALFAYSQYLEQEGRQITF